MRWSKRCELVRKRMNIEHELKQYDKKSEIPQNLMDRIKYVEKGLEELP